MDRIRLTVILAVTACVGRTTPEQGTPRRLGPEESYSWSIRASHSDELLLAVGDSVDIVLLRDRCGADAGHGMRGCWDASTVSVTPTWRVVGNVMARVRPLRQGSWVFGRGTAGARLYALRPGVGMVTAKLPDGELVSDSIQVISAPGAVRILLEPKPATIVAGDTVRFRVTARDSTGRIVAVLPLPHGWNVVGRPDDEGYVPVAFYPSENGGKLVPRLGRFTDTLVLHFVARRGP